MDFLYHSAAVDLASGLAVPALLSAASRDSGVGLALAGAALGAGLSYPDRLRNTLPVARSALAIALSARQVFALWEARDSDIGAGLVAIPLFFLTCALPVGSASEYLRRALAVSSALNAAVLVAAGVYYSQNEPALAPTSDFEGGAWQALAVSDVAFSSSAPPWSTPRPVWVAAIRGAVFVALAAAQHVARGVIGGSGPTWLLLLYTACLVQSSQAHATSIRLQLTGRDPQRVLMLITSAALTWGYVEREGDPAVTSFVALGVICATLAVWVLRKKFQDRPE